MKPGSISIVAVLAGVLLLIVGAGVSATIGTIRSDSARTVMQATPAPPETSEFRPVLATGSVRLFAGARVEVGAQISGRVRALAVTQGSMVRAGQVIAQLDTQEAHTLVEQAVAQVRELTAAEAQAVDQAQRVEALAFARSTTQQELISAKATAAQASARLDAARSAEALARIRLGYTTVHAPITGIVSSVTTHEGETVAASLAAPTFVTLIDPTKLEAVALVDETDIGRVSLGDSAEFTVDAYPGKVYRGVVSRIAPDATIVGGVVDYEVTLSLVGATAGLKPQMTTSVTISHVRHRR
jgi:HlyD family secretion protein